MPQRAAENLLRTETGCGVGIAFPSRRVPAWADGPSAVRVDAQGGDTTPGLQ